MTNKLFKNNSNQIVYRANLQRTGTIICETITILVKYLDLQNWDQVRNLTFHENLLKKHSSNTIEAILRSIKLRFLDRSPELPAVKILAKILRKPISAVTKSQILYIYICTSDKLVQRIMFQLVKPRLGSSLNPELPRKDILDFFDSETKTHQELKNWSEYLKKRWTRGMLALLRDFGFMEKPPSTRLLRPIIRIEAFSFFLFWFLQSMSVTESIDHLIWDLYLLKDSQKRTLLNEAQAHGWCYFSTAGDIVELKPRYPSMEEWIDGLG